MTEAENTHILIIDDDESICRSMQMILERKGYQVDTVHTGSEGLDRINSSDYAIVFLDIRLPDMKGTDVLGKILEKSPETDVIMVTGHANVENTVDALNLGAKAYLTKPLDMNKTLEKVSTILSFQQQSSGAEETLSQITESVPDGLIGLDSESIIRFWNPAAEKLFGYASEDILGKHVAKIIPQYSKLESLSFSEQEKQGNIISTELAGVDSSGYSFPLSISLGPDISERREQKMLAVRDISELEREATDLRRKEAELELHSRIIRHDLKNDIQTLILYLEGIQMLSVGDNTELSEMVGSAINVTERMENILEKFSLIPEHTQMDFLQFIRNVAAEAEASYRGLSVEVESKFNSLDSAVPMIGLLNIVFSNLIRNTVDHAGKNAKIHIQLNLIDDGIQMLYYDNGPGIAKEVEGRLFNKGVSTKGGGMGLYICRQIMREMGGSIKLCDKSPTNGACFELIIPIK